MKFILGIANFDQDYGLTNKIHKKSIDKILNFIIRKNILEIDTATNYKKSNIVLSKSKLKNQFKINLKIPRIHGTNYKKKINHYLKDFKHKHGIKKLNSVMFHDPKQIFEKKIIDVIDHLKFLKKANEIQQFGFSIYSLKELEKILKITNPDIIQVPLNIFDQRFVNQKLLKKIEISKIQIQFRSIFLQGVALHKTNFKNKKTEQIIRNYWKKIEQKNIDPLKNTMMLLSRYRKKGQFIISGDTIKQFKEIMSNKDIKLNKKKFLNFRTKYEKLIIPYLWQKK